jgi:hypothetical protein
MHLVAELRVIKYLQIYTFFRYDATVTIGKIENKNADGRNTALNGRRLSHNRQKNNACKRNGFIPRPCLFEYT